MTTHDSRLAPILGSNPVDQVVTRDHQRQNPVVNSVAETNVAAPVYQITSRNALPIQQNIAAPQQCANNPYLAAYHNPYYAQNVDPVYGLGPAYGSWVASTPYPELPYGGLFPTQIDYPDIQDQNRTKTEGLNAYAGVKLPINEQGNSRQTQYMEVSLHHAINLLLTYDGNSNLLAVFCKAIRNIIREFGPGSERWVMMTLPIKLKGRAAAGYSARLTQYITVEAFLSDLTMQFRGFSSADTVLMEIVQDMAY